ncbi:MAG: transposase-like protein [Planctomycetota bacterium]|jgi:transposase-like protein
MKNKRRTHSPEFKARVALEALKGLKPIHQTTSTPVSDKASKVTMVEN